METLIETLPVRRLRFHTSHGPGEMILRADDTVQITVPPPVRQQLKAITDDAQTSAVKWGSSLTVGLAALGAVFHLRGRPALSGVALTLGGASGLLARQAKRQAARWPRQAFAPVATRNVTLTTNTDGTLTVALRLPAPAPPYTLTLAPGEFDVAEALAFAAAIK